MPPIFKKYCMGYCDDYFYRKYVCVCVSLSVNLYFKPQFTLTIQSTKKTKAQNMQEIKLAVPEFVLALI